MIFFGDFVIFYGLLGFLGGFWDFFFGFFYFSWDFREGVRRFFELRTPWNHNNIRLKKEINN